MHLYACWAEAVAKPRRETSKHRKPFNAPQEQEADTDWENSLKGQL